MAQTVTCEDGQRRFVLPSDGINKMQSLGTTREPKQVINAEGIFNQLLASSIPRPFFPSLRCRVAGNLFIPLLLPILHPHSSFSRVTSRVRLEASQELVKSDEPSKISLARILASYQLRKSKHTDRILRER